MGDEMSFDQWWVLQVGHPPCDGWERRAFDLAEGAWTYQETARSIDREKAAHLARLEGQLEDRDPVGRARFWIGLLLVAAISSALVLVGGCDEETEPDCLDWLVCYEVCKSENVETEILWTATQSCARECPGKTLAAEILMQAESDLDYSAQIHALDEIAYNEAVQARLECAKEGS